MKNFIRSVIAVLLMLAATIMPGSAAQANPGFFTIAVIPDTQNYSQFFPEIFDGQAQWLVDNAAAQNIVFIAHEGDLVNDLEAPAEWLNAKHSMGIIRNAGIPYSVVPGNHDLVRTTGDASYFDANFPYTDFTGYTWYGGHYPETSNACNYALFSAMGQDFIVLNLACSRSLLTDAASWANSVLTQYGSRKAIVVTHGYIDQTGSYTDNSNVSGVEIWNNIVQYHANVVAVFCGHIHGKFHGTSTGVNGNVIENLLVDTQADPNGGNGWLRLYRFYPDYNRVVAVTYSPYLSQYDTTAAGQFSFPMNMDGTMISPSISLDRTGGLSGNMVTVTGTDFAASETGIQITFDGSAVASGITANATGNWIGAFTVPVAPVGAHSVSAFGSVTPSDLISDVTYTVGQPIWDLNGDHSCNIADVVRVGLKWGQTGTAGWLSEDLNSDGAINIGDVVVLGLHWGNTW